MRIRLCIAALALAAAGCATGLPDDVAQRGYVNRKARFAMDVPQGWSVRETTGTAAVILSGPESPAAGRPNVNVVLAPSRDGMTLEDLVQAGRSALEKLPNFKLLSEGPAEAGRRRAWSVAFEETSTGRPVRQKQLYVVTGGRGYIATAAALPEGFAAEEPNFDLCFRSFRAGW